MTPPSEPKATFSESVDQSLRFLAMACEQLESMSKAQAQADLGYLWDRYVLHRRKPDATE